MGMAPRRLTYSLMLSGRAGLLTRSLRMSRRLITRYLSRGVVAALPRVASVL